MNEYTLTVVITTENPDKAAVVDDVRWLLTDAAQGYVGEPDRPIGGATITTTEAAA